MSAPTSSSTVVASNSSSSPVPGSPVSVAAAVAAPNASLYVGDLDQSVTESQLYDVFNRVAPVLSIRVCRDQVSHNSLGYAYVNFNTSDEANTAMDSLNYTNVNGKPIRIMFSHRDPTIRKSGAANIFIKNLDRSVGNKELHDIFNPFGPILSCKVATDHTGQSKGYGFVQFEQENAAQEAIEKLNGMLVNDKKVYVGVFLRNEERNQSSGSKFNNVYVKNLSEETADEDLKETFGNYGEITSAVVMRDGEGKSRGFGFVNFKNPEDAARAVEELNGKKMKDDREWYVGKAQKKAEREAELRAKFEQERRSRLEKLQGANLYLKNLDDSIDDEKLKSMFEEFGTIISCKVMRDQQGQSRGSGFVAFSAPEEAVSAINEMNNKMVGGKPLYVAFAQRKDERQARLQAQYAQFRPPFAVAPAISANLSPYHPVAPRLPPQQLFYGQPPHGLIPQQPPAFGYQQQMMPGMRPGGQMPNFVMPFPMQRPSYQGQRMGGRRGGQNHFQQQQLGLQRNGNQNFRMPPNMRNGPDPNFMSQGVMPAMMTGPSDMAGAQAANSDVGRTRVSIETLASDLASASRDQQRAMLGEQLFPLIAQLEPELAAKITGMLLEMDQNEILHIIESPEDLRAKVQEAMDVLRLSQTSVTNTADHLSSLSLGA